MTPGISCLIRACTARWMSAITSATIHRTNDAWWGRMVLFGVCRIDVKARAYVRTAISTRLNTILIFTVGLPNIPFGNISDITVTR